MTSKLSGPHFPMGLGHALHVGRCATLALLSACVGTSDLPAGPHGQGGGSSTGENDGNAQGPDGDPGRVTLHRLNRVEYDNTVKDLLGTTLKPADVFPPDDRGYGYDNIADVLSLSPLLLELYYNAAERLIDDTLSAGGGLEDRREAEGGAGSIGQAEGSAWVLTAEGQVSQRFQIASPGEYIVRVRAWQERAGSDPARMEVRINGATVATVDVSEEAGAPRLFETRATLSSGAQEIAATFENDLYDANQGLDRNLVVDYFELEGPSGAGGGQRGRIMICEPDAADPLPCLERVVETFGRRAFRRPLAPDEVTKLLMLFQKTAAAGDDLETSLRVMLRAMLVSPHFLFRVELDDEPGKGHALSGFELASRLSYFLWSSMPDDALLAAAEAGELDDDEGIRTQVRRMLADPRAEALVQNFGGQWLFARAVSDLHPDANFYPAFDEELKASARRETEAYFRTFLQGEDTMDRFLTADYGFLDDRLAEHYGMAAPNASEVEHTTLPEGRVGLLTQTTFLSVTSYPTRTSPVKRGKWLLEQILCTPPPPPPANIPPLEEGQGEAKTVREQLEQHRKNPVCAACHKVMDPLGFGLESYDGVGGFRTTENGHPVDDSGELPDGTAFRGAVELAALLQSDARFPRCVTEHLVTYALGRGLERKDRAHVDRIAEHFVEGGYLMPALIEEVALSPAFRTRGAEAEENAP